MALMACKECGKEISDKASACPSCGAPTTTPSVTAAPTPPKEKRKTTPAAWAGLILVVAGILWYSQTREYKEQSLPPIPVAVQHRPAMLGPGEVLRVNNTSGQAIFAVVTLTNPTTKETKSFRIDIPAKQFAEIGHREGWVLAPGDTVVISNDAFKSWQGSI